MKTIAVMVVTWPRHAERIKYFQRTVDAFRENVRASSHRIYLNASVESQDVTRELENEWRLAAFRARIDSGLWRHGDPASVGGNMNHAGRKGAQRADYVFLLMDDWIISDPLDLSPYCDFLDCHDDFAMVRFGWSEIGNHTILIGGLSWFQLRPGAGGVSHPISIMDPRSIYFYSDHPHLRRNTWEAETGPFSERPKDVGHGEVEMNGRMKASRWQIAAAHQNYFQHCGDVPSVTEDERWISHPNRPA